MTIYQQIIDVCNGQEGNIITTSHIKEMVWMKYKTNRTSVIPSDYCYNRINEGIRFNQHLFIILNRGEYKFIGEHYPYSGFIFFQPKGTSEERVVGEWRHGDYYVWERIANIPDEKYRPELNTNGGLNQAQIQLLYEEYMRVLELEVKIFGCQPTETRHLIGRLGEFKSALLTNGTLAREINQHGFDVIGASGRRISVKTTAQKSGFVSINQNTLDKVDDLIILQFHDGEFKTMYHGTIHEAVTVARTWKNTYELSVSKAKKLMKDQRTKTNQHMS
jgi:hypothetical protein